VTALDQHVISTIQKLLHKTFDMKDSLVKKWPLLSVLRGLYWRVPNRRWSRRRWNDVG